MKPHSATQANAAVYRALLEPGAMVLALDPAHGGQITPGAPTDISGCPYHVVTYHVDHDTSMVDMNEVERDCARTPAASDPRRLVGLSPDTGFPTLPRDR